MSPPGVSLQGLRFVQSMRLSVAAIGDDGFAVPLIGDRVEAGGFCSLRNILLDYDRIGRFGFPSAPQTIFINAIDNILPIANPSLIATIV